MKYQYVGITEDSTATVIFSGVRDKGFIFVLAARTAVKLRCNTNPKKFVRVEIQDYEGKILPEYENHELLKVYY